MDCPYCGFKTRVNNSRSLKSLPGVWRRRQCKQCQAIWTTKEEIDYQTAFVQKNGAKAFKPFSRDEIMLMVYESTKHRKDALKHSRALTDTILKRSLPMAKDGVLESSDLNSVIQQTLKRFDPVAETYFTAYFINRS